MNSSVPPTQHSKRLAIGLTTTALVVAAVLVACRKEHPAPFTGHSEASLNATPRVKAFIEKAGQVAGAKDLGVLSVDSTEWYVEAALNYSLAEAWLEGKDLAWDSTGPGS